MGPTLLDMSKIIRPGPYCRPDTHSGYYECSTETHPVYLEYFKKVEGGIRQNWHGSWYLFQDTLRVDLVFRGKVRESLGELNQSFYREMRIGIPCSDEQIIDPEVLFTFVPDWTPFFMKSCAEDLGQWVLVRFGKVMTCDPDGRRTDYRPKVRDISDDCFAECRFYYGPNMDPWDDEDFEEDTIEELVTEKFVEERDKFLISWDISNKEERID